MSSASDNPHGPVSVSPAHAAPSESVVSQLVEPLATRSTLSGTSSVRGPWPIAGLLLLFGALFLVGYLPRRERLLKLSETRAHKAAPQIAAVGLTKPKRAARTQNLRLPTTLIAHEQTVVYARAAGYVRRCLVDIGDRVEARQLLLELDTPELVRELEQARASLQQRAAALELARAAHAYTLSDLARYEQLTERKMSSRQELERHQAEARVDAAKVQVAEAEQRAQGAEVRRLEQLKTFAQVLAPFAGTITKRTVERGSLVSAGTAAPLFEIASSQPLRALVHVPQSLFAGVKSGLAAELELPEYPSRKFAAHVSRTSGRLDEKTRTLLVELEIDNREGALLPGMFGSMGLSLESARDVFIVPATAVLFSKEGTRLAVVGPEGTVKLVEVVIERDRGAEVEIASGLSAVDEVVTNPVPGLSDGVKVRAPRTL